MLQSFYWSSLTFGYLRYSTLLTTTAKRKYYSRVFAFIRVELRAFSDQQTTFTYSQGTILQSRDLNLHLERAQKTALSTKLISQTLILRPYIFNAKNYFYGKSGMHVQNCKTKCRVEFFQLRNFNFFLNLRKIYSTKFS